ATGWPEKPAACGCCAPVARGGAPGDGLPEPKRKPRRISAPRREVTSATQAQLLDQALVALVVLALEIVEQAAAAVDQLQEAAAAVVILLVDLEVLGQLLDAGGQQGDLDLRRAGVVGAARVVGNNLLGV